MREARKKSFATLALCIALVFFPAIVAYAAVVLERPVNVGPGNRNLGMKFHPIQKKWKPHKGQDYPVQTGTNINMGSGITGMECRNDPNGYGSYAVVNYECNVQAIFAHLSSCDAASRTAISGNSGGSTGPHLHYEIKLGGAVVQPESALGKDLCDPAVREQLINEANDALNGQAGKDGEVAPINDGAGKTTYVPPTGGGSAHGGTDGYYIYEDEDGRVTIIPDNVANPDVPALPPGEPADLTGETDTDNEVTGCATDTWAAMVNQAVLQTRRETIMNQTFIAKPDSVMAYACITDAFDNVRENAGPIFSESKRWVNVDVDIITKTVNVNKELGEYSLDGAMVNVAYTPYEVWMRTNFSHDFLGGTVADSGGHDHDDGHAHVEDQSYTPCGAMAQVWQMAKCKNADEENLFPTFEELINNDPRQYPERYACNYTGITQDMIETAKGKSVDFDKLNPYFDLLYPDNTGTCAPAVSTGVTVVYRRLPTDADICPSGDPLKCDIDEWIGTDRVAIEDSHPDKMCLTAGCSYQVDENGGGHCVLYEGVPEEDAPPSIQEYRRAYEQGEIDYEEYQRRLYEEYSRGRMQGM